MPVLKRVIKVPRLLTASACPAVTAFCREIADCDADKIELDGSPLQLADPFGLCLAAATLQGVTNAGREVVVRDLAENQLHYLARMHFFRKAGIEVAASAASLGRPTLQIDVLQLRQISAEREIDHVARSLAEATVGRIPGMKKRQVPDEMTGHTERERLTNPLHYLFSELLTNALTHARQHQHQHASAWVASRYDSSRDRLALAIVDDGCGLKRSLAKHPALKDSSDLAAIAAAVEPRVSSNRDVGLVLPGYDSVNEGIGLTICRDIAVNSAGAMHIVSGIGYTMFRPHGEPRKRELFPWHGTAVAAELDQSALKVVQLAAIFARYRDQMKTRSVVKFVS